MRLVLFSWLFAGLVAAQAAPPAKQMERLDRGLVAVPAAQGVFLSWRLLGTEPAGLRFNVYRGERRLNEQPQTLTNFLDAQGKADSRYTVRAVLDGKELPAEAAVAPWAQPFLSVPIQKPADGVSPDGVAYSYQANDGSAADLDGDGRYELIVKWQPTNAKDNSQRGHTGHTYLDAYKLDGTRLWRIDLGPNIRAGAHYTTYLAYDFDGDGRAEVMMKTADGTVDGRGRVIGDAKADYRNEAGYVLAGPEFLTVFDGLSGAALASTAYVPARGEVKDWGDAYGNRVDRFLGGVAFLDGQRPSAVFSRGYYTRAVIAAWDWRDGKLTQRWVFDSNDAAAAGGAAVAGQGAHWFSVADVDGDGRQDIIYGAATIGSDGRMLYSTGLCHGDALHVGQLDPARPGQQVFMVHESPRCYGDHGLEMHDAATGKVLWSMSGQGKDVGRGVCFDIDPKYPGAECWGSVGGLMTAGGQLISEQHPNRMNFAVWWDGDLLRESLDGTAIDKWNPAAFRFENVLNGKAFDAASNNGTKANPVLSADLFGDWREEVVWRNADSTALLIFSTALPTGHRLATLMHDPQYRMQVASQNAGYNQPPHTSFYLGEGMKEPVREAIYTPSAGAPRPLFRDPVLDGAADVALVFNKGAVRWEMFYTNRRATLRLDDPKDVSWVHATPIGIATTDDGNHWRAAGEAKFPAECTGATLWAPEILEVEGVYHLWLTIVPGVHKNWTGTRFLQHLTSRDLRDWRCEERVDLGSDKVIDASVVRLGEGRWRLWYKDEEGSSKLKFADSADLKRWTPRGPVSALPGEGPKVFRFGGKWWLVADLWKGLLAMRSDDAEHWQEQPTRLLADPGVHATDKAKGQHPDVQLVGGRAFIFYFVHQGNEDEAKGDDRYHQRTVIQVAELKLDENGWLRLDRNAPPPDLGPLFGSRL
ncbi:hypothetical protein [Pelomonas sp. SE-A7]|uniref:rhamnogalacturonan lyase family protein n=1 Tax=Pelomonas sp. SE-A7 TaxID=3054953 RepID=UPI00259D2913|nr:hypothetical protein [Pelomonas sp. SE-A7]MDM4765264.1 hypothetical protein [Pelomonas sp. SE-A7]